MPKNAQSFHFKIAFLLSDLSGGNKRATNSKDNLCTTSNNCISLFLDFS